MENDTKQGIFKGLILSLIFIILISGMVYLFKNTESGEHKSNRFNELCKGRNLTYESPVVIPGCYYECMDQNMKIHMFKDKKCHVAQKGE